MTLTLPAYTTLTLDDVFLTGKHQGAQPFDPIDAMSLGMPFGTSLALLPDADAVAVLSRLSEGAGSTIGNEGQGDGGSLLAGAWTGDPTGRVQLVNPQMQFLHHESMNHVIDVGGSTILSISAAFRVRNWTAGTLFDKQSVIAVSREDFPSTLPVDEWFTVGVSLQGDDLRTYVNGQQQGDATLSTPRTADPGNPLFIGREFDGDAPIAAEVDDVVYSGGTLALSLIQATNPANGLWTSEVIDLGSTKTLSRITHANSYVLPTHRLFLEIRLGDGAELSAFRREAWDLGRDYIEHPAQGFYPTTLLQGRYLQAQLSLSQAAQTPFRPLLRNLVLRLR